MTAEQNVEFGLRIGHTGSRYPHRLSGGMHQRVALVIEPRVLLLDEPLPALDVKVRVQPREETAIQLELGITTLYVTHDREGALSVSDRAAVVSGGHIEQIGTPTQMGTEPATPFVAEFIGTMNRLQAIVTDGVGGSVDHAGVLLRLHEAKGRSSGERVLVLVRPELLELAAGTNGTAPRRQRCRRRGDQPHLPRFCRAFEGERPERRANRRHAGATGRGPAGREPGRRARTRRGHRLLTLPAEAAGTVAPAADGR
jgi:ABC-type Fe3+/spermidine/putrescine transport system ATPase subunit